MALNKMTMCNFFQIITYYVAQFLVWLEGLFKDSLKAFDYFELYVYDVNCIPKGRLVERTRLQEIIKRGGLGSNAAICYFTVDGDPLNHPWFGTKEKPGNSYMRPDLKTLAKAPKTSVGEYKVGQITCDLVLEGRKIPNWRTIGIKDFDPTSPRTVALRQLQKLNEKGFKINYCFEMEFTLLKSGHPLDKATSWGNMVDLLKTEEMMLEFMEGLRDANVNCATLHCETGPSQFEFVLKMAQGIQGADMAACFKKEAQAFFEKRDLFAQFHSYTESVGEKFCRTMNLNHYLSTKCITGKRNTFNNGEKRVSELAWRWMAGINRHLPALMALFCPTENCYKRYTNDFVRKLEFYSVHQRHSCIRRKKEGKEMYLENRLPSSFSNPYLVLAGTIAAGLDGIKKYPWGARETRTLRVPPLPRNLQDALQKLEGDAFLKEELESNFVDIFIAMKRKELNQR